MTSGVTNLWVCDKAVFRIGFPTQRKGANQKMQIFSKILWFSWQKQIQEIKLFKYYTEKDKNKFGQSLHR